MRLVAALLAAVCAGAVAVEARKGRRAAPSARRAVSRFLAVQARLSNPFSDYEGQYCVSRTTQFIESAASQEVTKDELPGYMASLCQTHLCHFKRTGTVYQVNRICDAVRGFFQARADKGVKATEGVEGAVNMYCKQLQEEIEDAPGDVPPLFKVPFECPYEQYLADKREELQDAEERREEEDSTPDVDYVVAAEV